jgi:hypothetical protein
MVCNPAMQLHVLCMYTILKKGYLTCIENALSHESLLYTVDKHGQAHGH